MDAAPFVLLIYKIPFSWYYIFNFSVDISYVFLCFSRDDVKIILNSGFWE